jgi:putative FmdB family regulatory protein
MPTYDYQCTACKHRFEQFQSMTAAPLRKCPECGKTALKRLIGTGAAIIFKGSGFYQTDYRSDSYKASEKAETESAKPKTDGDTKPKAEPVKAETTTTKPEPAQKSEPAPKPDTSKSDTPRKSSKRRRN